MPQPTAIEKPQEPNTSYSLIIKSVTWKKESYGLFDYENKNTTSSILKTTQPGLVKKLGEDVLLFNDHKFFENDNPPSPKLSPSNNDKSGQNTSTLVSISIKNNFFWIHNSNKKLINYLTSIGHPSMKSLTDSPKSSKLNHQKTQSNLLDNAGFYKQVIENGPWMVVRFFNENQGFQLFPNDFLKLGRITFKVRDIFLDNKHVENVSNFRISRKSTQVDKQTLTDHGDNEDEENVVKQCRICLSDNNSTPQGSVKNCMNFENAKDKPSEDDNPFINPCRCSGTMKYIHVKCLQFWLASKIQIKQTSDSCKTLSWKNIECELCKFEFPMLLNHNKKEYELIKIPKPEGSSSYIILDILCKESNQTKGIHILDLENKDLIKIGRGNENDLKISDISVSRTHALIKKRNNELFVEDSNSKFGTLVLMKKAYPLNNPNQMTAVQLGRIVLYFSLCLNSSSGFNLCCKKNVQTNDLNEKIDEELISQDELVLENKKNDDPEDNRISQVPQISEQRSEEHEDPEPENPNDIYESNRNNETHHISHNQI